ncbi:hypothetical protein BU23DRAFT_646254 [Bimuria novae-zelandiae CBS 107.79]|uniref:Uncharacterized protein n=1 Tax=Bimuria novae-zelandiae CBS 107.79 TaxID=1447943 RepID=A0A6A5V9K5_9PLEO|nr:hypothetical protein BU23DRAFT_646254 [Bimuria novae-zelandiae CBS 107.79]
MSTAFITALFTIQFATLFQGAPVPERDTLLPGDLVFYKTATGANNKLAVDAKRDGPLAMTVTEIDDPGLDARLVDLADSLTPKATDNASDRRESKANGEGTSSPSQYFGTHAVGGDPLAMMWTKKYDEEEVDSTS